MSKKIGLFLGAAGIIIVPLLTVLIVLEMRSSGKGGPGAISEEGYRATVSGLKIKDEQIGDGAEVTPGVTIVANYTGKLMDGKQFDSSEGKGPFEFQLGAGTIIKGWEEGITGMKVGGKRKLIIPPDLAYGARGAPGIPPHSKLYFEIEIVRIVGAISEEGFRGVGLKIKDEQVGTGDEAVAGKSATVHYTGKFLDGKQFDSSVGKPPFKFPIGGGAVIKGWDQGVVGMKVGGKRKLIIPPELGYGVEGGSGIPPNSRLYFEIELLKVE